MLKPPRELGLMLAAYKLQLARQAERLGQKSVGTWGSLIQLSADTEEQLIEGEGEFRLPPFPYPGLRAFDSREGKLYFGRDNSISEIQRRLASYGIVAILGGSGSGKSSLIRAGLLPYLNSTRRMPGRVGSWYMAEFRPRMNPLCELAHALVDQVMLPLLALDLPTLNHAMDLPTGEPADKTKQLLRTRVRRQLKDAQARGPGAVKDWLLDFVDRRLDNFDGLASEGVRLPGASLMLLIDQFEEVFRPEVSAEERIAFLDLVVSLHASIRRHRQLNEIAYRGGLFVAITMRSEELHRCAEHRGLSEVINRSLYLLELMDPENTADGEDLRAAILQPARDVLDDWGLTYDRNNPDAPYEKGMPDWLISGAGRRLTHQPDQLPLLQHALQATWHAAMRRWSGETFSGSQLEILKTDLPGQTNPLPSRPDLGNCLCVRADKATDRAAERFAQHSGSSRTEGEKALQAAFRSLAYRDDMGNWARRFAELADIKAFMNADPLLATLSSPDGAIRHALDEFLIRGFLSGGTSVPYDISHEALIRNWRTFQKWLNEPDNVARALERVVEGIDPRLETRSKRKWRQQVLDWIPTVISSQLAPVLGPSPTLPHSWALQHLKPMLERSSLKERWQDVAPNANNDQLAHIVLAKIEGARKLADAERSKETTRRRTQRLFIYGSLELMAVILVGAVLLWFALEKSTSALYAAHAESLLGGAATERGSEWAPEVRARVVLRSNSYSDAASRLGVQRPGDQWIQDNILRIISNASIGTYLPTLTNEESQRRARQAFDFTSRVVLGRRFIIRDVKEVLPQERSSNCQIVGTAQEAWQPLVPEKATERRPTRGFRVKQDSVVQNSQRVEFAAREKYDEFRVADSDLQISLASGARLCLSDDGTTLSLSSPGQSFPDLYEMQWTRCGAETQCKRNGFEWRVRYIPIEYAPGIDLLPAATFPCVTSIKYVPSAAQAEGAMKIEVRYTAQEAATCSSMLSGKTFVAEFYTRLAAPRAVDIPDLMKPLLSKCIPINRGADIQACHIDTLIKWNIGDTVATSAQVKNKTPVTVTIHKRVNHDIVDVDVKDSSSEIFAADKISMPAAHIDLAGITESGDVLLYDDAAQITWSFISKRSQLEQLLQERGNCRAQHAKDKISFAELGELARLDINRACE
jgi:hypothetical protein